MLVMLTLPSTLLIQDSEQIYQKGMDRTIKYIYIYV